MVTTKNNKNNTNNNRNDKSAQHPHAKHQDRHPDLVDSFQWGFVEGADNDTAENRNEARTQGKSRKKSKMKTVAKNTSVSSVSSPVSLESATKQINTPAPKITTSKTNKNTEKNRPKKKKNRQIINTSVNNVTDIVEADKLNAVGGTAGKVVTDSSFVTSAKNPVANQNQTANNPKSKAIPKSPRRKITAAQNNSTPNINKTKEHDTNLLFEPFDDENDLNLPSYGRTYKDKKLQLDQETKHPESQNIVKEKRQHPHYQSPTPTPIPSSIPTPSPSIPHATAKPVTPNSVTVTPTPPQSNFTKPASYPQPPITSNSVAQNIVSASASASDFRNVNLDSNKSGHIQSSLETPISKPKKEQMVWDPDKREYVPLKVFDQSLPASLPEPPTQSHTKPQHQTTTPKQPQTKSDQNTNTTVTQSNLIKNNQPIVNNKIVTENSTTPKLSTITNTENRLHSNVPQRGNIPRPVASTCPDPADIEADARGFASLGLSDVMLEALRILRYIEPTPIQAGVFDRVKTGKDIMGQAQTGTGKTAAFSIPIIEGIEECPPGDEPVALILVPTRELAVQVRDEILRLSYGRDIRIAACYGGKPIVKQIAKLNDGIDVVVGTPGRVLDLMNRRTLITDSLKWVVLDEADRMLDIGFRPDIEKILKKSPSTRQTLLFSATLPPPVVKLAERYMREPEVLDFSNKHVSVDTIEQFYVTVDRERKFDALVYLLNEERPNQAIIFTRTKRGADRLARLLSKQIPSLSAIHGDLQQSERDKIMSKFRAGELRYLVATDVVGRGIDVSGISHIINYDIPHFCDDYVHRVGRTGRMGREGVAYTFVTAEEGNELTRIEMRIDKLLKRADLKGFESFSKPVQDTNNNDSQSINHKPVFGKPIRKIRRAL
ncbi:MAG: DEAD/DEAH box helicase [Planctomycetaceae bacterium]|jgi:ATP-dependent RNA helicase DeaD|nr:DEAD/DEAH box helicase [Planctomycetaceae bacterium]